MSKSNVAMALLVVSALVGCHRNEPAAAGGTAPTANGAAARALAVPGQATGALQQGDPALADGSLGDDYSVSLTAGQPVTFVVRGRAAIGGEGNMDAYA